MIIQLDAISPFLVSSALVKPILNVLGASLTSLSLCNLVIRYPVDMAQLASCCTQLVKLSLFKCNIFNARDVDAAGRWTEDTFLPLLTSFKSVDTCLGVWAPLIEKKSKLVELELNCCHIGTKV